VTDYVLELKMHVYVDVKIIKLYWNLVTDYVLELKMHVCVDIKIIKLCWNLESSD